MLTSPQRILGALCSVALLAHIGTKTFSPLSQRLSMDWQHSKMSVVADALEVRDIFKFQVFHAVKWACIGLVLALMLL